MDEIYAGFSDFLKKPAVVETLIDIVLCAVPIWLAVMIGLVIGWSWRPRWTGLLFLGLRSRFRFFWTAPPGLGARRLWLAFTALSAFSVCRKLWSSFSAKETQGPASGGELTVERDGAGFSSAAFCPQNDAVTEKDLEHLIHLIGGGDEDMVWQNQMERATSNMAYQVWRHEPKTGPVIYRSKTIFEDATPELVRDFFWDDEFRSKWDSMLIFFKILQEFPKSATTVVHWIKKFPFFCSDREYIIGRRIWEFRKTYYCVTKGVPYPSLPKQEKPRRVELYFSSWRIRAVESRRHEGQISACEVALVHYEDMGIPRDVAKMGVHHAMWGAVKKLHSGMRAYQLVMTPAATQITTTKLPFVNDADLSDEPPATQDDDDKKKNKAAGGGNRSLDWKWIAIGGAAIVCGLQTGLIAKALLLGAARRMSRN